VNIDSIVLKVTYSAPGFEAHRCATTTTPPSCAILETKTNPNIYFRGTFYAPTARVTVKVHNKGDTVFQRGIIARMIDACRPVHGRSQQQREASRQGAVHRHVKQRHGTARLPGEDPELGCRPMRSNTPQKSPHWADVGSSVDTA
jgi:hypothetical protein